MKRIRVAVCLIFIAACIIFGVYTVKVRMVEDHVPPEISFDQDTIQVSVKDDASALMAGVSAKDNRDGDISQNVTILSKSNFISKGKRTVSYIVFDSANQPAVAERTIEYTDYTQPKIFIGEPLRYSNTDLYNADLTKSVTVSDCLDGDLTNKLHISYGDDIYTEGNDAVSITFYVNNSAGDVFKLPVTVHVTDPTDRTESQRYYPLLKQYVVYTEKGKKLKLDKYITGVMRGNTTYDFDYDEDYLGFTKDDITIKSDVNYKKPGIYKVTYSYTDEENDITGTTDLYVVVEE